MFVEAGVCTQANFPNKLDSYQTSHIAIDFWLFVLANKYHSAMYQRQNYLENTKSTRRVK